MKNPKIFYINLEKDQKRKINIEKEIDKLNLSGSRIPGVWWNDLPGKDQEILYSQKENERSYYKPLVNGEKGCYASHIMAWHKLLKSNDDYCVILEDDVNLSNDFKKVIEAINSISSDWDMIKLMGRKKEKISKKYPLVDSYDLIQYSKIPSFTAGYLISRQGAEKLLATRIPFGRPIDIDLRFWWENEMRIFGVFPGVIYLNENSEQTSIIDRDKNSNFKTSWRKLKMKIQLAIGSLLFHPPKLPKPRNGQVD